MEEFLNSSDDEDNDLVIPKEADASQSLVIPIENERNQSPIDSGDNTYNEAFEKQTTTIGSVEGTHNDEKEGHKAAAGSNEREEENENSVLAAPKQIEAVSMWPHRVMSAFLSKEESLPMEIGGISQCFVRKKFKMDPISSVVKCYIDVEVIDKSPPLYNYTILSAHCNSSLKTLVLARAIVKLANSRKKFVVLAVLRTKCTSPRYDVVLMDVVNTKEIFRVPLSKFKKDYVYCIEENFDYAFCSDAFQKWLFNNKLVWDKTKPNKLEDGTPDHTTWNPKHIGRPQRRSSSQLLPAPRVITNKKKKTTTAPNKDTTKKSRGLKRKKRNVVVEHAENDRDDSDVEVLGGIESADEEEDDDQKAEASKIMLLKEKIRAKKKANLELQKQKRIKLEADLLKLQQQDEDDEEDKHIGILYPSTDINSSKSKRKEKVIDHAPISSRDFTVQAQIIQNQAIRISDSYYARRNAELQLALLENIAMHGFNSGK